MYDMSQSKAAWDNWSFAAEEAKQQVSSRTAKKQLKS